MSLRDAATIPVVYTTIYYAFFFYRPVTSGKTILIHAGSGGIGLAAIRIALAYGLEVFTTVSTEPKKKFIMDMFPQLKGKSIGFCLRTENNQNSTISDLFPLQRRILEIHVTVHSNK